MTVKYCDGKKKKAFQFFANGALLHKTRGKNIEPPLLCTKDVSPDRLMPAESKKILQVKQTSIIPNPKCRMVGIKELTSSPGTSPQGKMKWKVLLMSSYSVELKFGMLVIHRHEQEYDLSNFTRRR